MDPVISSASMPPQARPSAVSLGVVRVSISLPSRLTVKAPAPASSDRVGSLLAKLR